MIRYVIGYLSVFRPAFDDGGEGGGISITIFPT